MFTWKIVEYGKRYETDGVPGGEWQLDPPSGDGPYTLHPAGSCRCVKISGQLSLYPVLDVATEFIKEKTNGNS